MDIVTQGLLGSTVGVAAYNKKLGRRAAIYGFLIGLMPDFDIIAGYWGEWASLKYHRGPTHAFLVLILLSIPLGLTCRYLSRSDARKRDWIGLAFLSLITHPIIDWFTTYGTSLAWPFSDRRFAIDALPIIDPVFSLPLLIVTVLGLYFRNGSARMQTFAGIALAAASIYAFSGWHTSQTLIERGSKIFQAAGFAPVEVRAMPTFLNTVVYRVVGRDANDRFMVTYLKKAASQPLTEPITVDSDRDEFVTRALEHQHGRLFKWFATNMLRARSVALPDGGHKVLLDDMRYGLFLDPASALFCAEASFDAEGRLTGIKRLQNHRSINMKKELGATLAHVFGDRSEPAPASYGD